MKFLLLSVLAALVVPSTGLAAEPDLFTRDVPLRGARALAASAATPRSFDLVGIHWQGPGTVLFRTRSVSGGWSRWHEAMPEPLDIPDAGTPEATSARTWKLGNPYWVGPSTAIRYRLRGRVDRLRTNFVRSAATAVPPRRTSIAGSPLLTLRSAWGANEQIRRGSTSYAPNLRFSVVHHTAGANSYTRAQSAAIVRAIQLYHVRGNGWNDIGYNFLVDKYGQVFEGRFGGAERNVVGAHAEGFNTGSVGVALLGTYTSAQPSASALTAIANLLAWRLDVGHADPLARLSWISGGNARFPSGTPVPLAAVAGHRDTGPTTCPGNALYRQLPTIARRVAEIGLPKLYDPIVTGRPGELVRFRARLSTLRAWSVTVTDETGAPVAVGRGEGTTVDWTWDATAYPAARYSYTIEAGTDMRPATGLVGQRATSLTLTGARATPRTFTPNGDSLADSTTIAYTISLAANVTATLRDVAGVTLATLFSEDKRAGRHTFKFSAQGIPDGRYTIAITARSPNSREVRSEVAIVIDRTLAAFRTEAPAVSPNGDRRNEELAVTFVLASPVNAKLKVLRGSRTVATPFEGPLAAGAQRLTWTPDVGEGNYAAVVEVAGPLGVRAQTARFVVDVTRPRVRLLSARLMRFSVSEGGTLVVNTGAQTARVPVLRRGWVVVPSLAGAGRFTATHWDFAGNSSRPVRYP
jgi:N-acetylmuramoyl-L-alanine amidase